MQTYDLFDIIGPRMVGPATRRARRGWGAWQTKSPEGTLSART